MKRGVGTIHACNATMLRDGAFGFIQRAFDQVRGDRQVRCRNRRRRWIDSTLDGYEAQVPAYLGRTPRRIRSSVSTQRILLVATRASRPRPCPRSTPER